MPDSVGQNMEKLSRILSDMMQKQEQIKESKKALRSAVKETEDVEMKSRLSELKKARKNLNGEIKDLQDQIEKQILADNPDIKSFREKVLELEEEEADLKVEIREISGPMLEKKAIIEIDVRGEGDIPAKVQLMRSVVASINGKEQSL